MNGDIACSYPHVGRVRPLTPSPAAVMWINRLPDARAPFVFNWLDTALYWQHVQRDFRRFIKQLFYAVHPLILFQVIFRFRNRYDQTRHEAPSQIPSVCRRHTDDTRLPPAGHNRIDDLSMGSLVRPCGAAPRIGVTIKNNSIRRFFFGRLRIPPFAAVRDLL
jgi:hypothetical protein